MPLASGHMSWFQIFVIWAGHIFKQTVLPDVKWKGRSSLKSYCEMLNAFRTLKPGKNRKKCLSSFTLMLGLLKKRGKEEEFYLLIIQITHKWTIALYPKACAWNGNPLPHLPDWPSLLAFERWPGFQQTLRAARRNALVAQKQTEAQPLTSPSCPPPHRTRQIST